MKQAPKKWDWAAFFAEERSMATRFFFSLLIAVVGIFFTYILFHETHFYFASVTIITVILIALFSGRFIGILFSVLVALTANYFFVLPTGVVLGSRERVEHLIIRMLTAIFVTLLSSSIRASYRLTIQAKQEVEHAKLETEGAKQQAEQASASMEQALALISHDVRNPLAVIEMSVQMILRTPDQSDKHQPLLIRILNNLNRADSMIQSLLDVASIRAGKALSLELTDCDLNTQITQMVEDLSLMVSSNQLKYNSDGPVWGKWGISGIRRALENLVTNAVKYGETNTPIIITVSKSLNQVYLSVCNQGAPISPDDQRKLFDSFSRTRGAETSAIRGWGLGLALVKGIAESHGGTVKVESGTTNGTIFTLILPIRNANVNAAEINKSVPQSDKNVDRTNHATLLK